MLRIIGVLLLIRGSIQPANSMMTGAVHAIKLRVSIAAIAKAYRHAGGRWRRQVALRRFIWVLW